MATSWRSIIAKALPIWRFRNEVSRTPRWKYATLITRWCYSSSRKLFTHSVPTLFPLLLSTACFEVVQCEKKKAVKAEVNDNKDIYDLVTKAKRLIADGKCCSEIEKLLVEALHLAIDRKDVKVITYVQDTLANFYLGTRHLDKAEKLFKNVLNNIIAMGTVESDPAVLEITLKLASIYAQLQKYDLAVAGYEWTAQVCASNIKAMIEMGKSVIDDDYKNGLALLGMILDSFGRYLHSMGNNQQALKNILQAIEIGQQIYGDTHQRILVLYNDVASIKCAIGEYDAALEYVLRAIKLSDTENNSIHVEDRAVFYYNLSHIYIKMNKKDLAHEAFENALVEVSKTNNEKLKARIASLAGQLDKFGKVQSTSDDADTNKPNLSNVKPSTKDPGCEHPKEQ